MDYYNSYVRFRNIDNDEIGRWKKDYKLLIKKSLKNTNRNRFLSKNPTNTARIEVLLDMFPNAKFIHIHRNPVEVFLSTRNFYNSMLPHLQLQSIPNEDLDGIILSIYHNLMNDYFEQRKLIPSGNLIEVAFDELEKNPEAILKSIYKTLNIDGYTKAEPKFRQYIDQLGSYKKNKHVISKHQLRMVINKCEFAMKKLDYTIPGNLEIYDE